MSLFVVISTHTSDQCPSANAKVRQLTSAFPKVVQELTQKLGIKILAGPFTSVSHRGFVIMDAPNVEAVWAYVTESGMVQWNSVDVVPVKAHAETQKEVAGLKPLY